MTSELIELIGNAAKTSRLVILGGAGADFCLGRTPVDRPSDPLERRRQGEIIFDCYRAIRACEIPVMAVVRGRAYGFGCAVSTACDITLAERTAEFGIPEMGHNVMPANAMSALIARVPIKTISYLAYTTAKISAERAMVAGIVSEIAAAEKLDGLAADIVGTIANLPKAAVNAIKEFVGSAPDMAIDGAIQYARNLHATINSAAEIRMSGHAKSKQ